MLNIIQKKKIWYSFSGLLLVVSILSLSLWGLKFGLDFTGGTLMEVSFTNSRPEVSKLNDELAKLNLGSVSIQPAGEKDVIFRLRDINEENHQQILTSLKTLGGELTELRFESVGPVIGSELKKRALWAVIIACLFIVSYIAWAFRKVSRPVASWKYGLSAVAALAHDVLITVGAFSLLGHFMGVEIDALFVSAILTVLGFSVHDTIVVFDRTRENLFRGASSDFTSTVNKSVNDTITRSINTSLTVLLVLSALFFLGGETIKYFALTLMIGITVGTYSSIFIASPLLVDWYNWGMKGRK